MKKHHVYGIGNALVDMEIEVQPEFLADMKIDKGVMTLVDEARQIELLSHLEGVAHKRNCGGSAANTIIAVSNLGGRAFYSCKVANDETGDFYFKDLVESGVETNLHGERESGVTGKCMVFITPDADRTMNTYLGITQNFSNLELEEDEIADSEWLYVEGYLISSPTGKQAAISARDIARNNNVKVALTLSDPFMVHSFKEGFLDVIGKQKVDLLFCNQEEAIAFGGKEKLEDNLTYLREYSNAFAITRGNQGALLFDGEKYIEVDAPSVKPLDTNGAGDLFAGSFLYAITHGHNFSSAGKLACHAASKLVTKFGARLLKEELLEVKSKVLS